MSSSRAPSVVISLMGGHRCGCPGTGVRLCLERLGMMTPTAADSTNNLVSREVRYLRCRRRQIDGVAIYSESHGEGFPLVWSHEFAGDYRSWEDQVRFFSRRYRVITYNARGYPPSDVPDDPGAYSQERSVEDLKGLLDHLGIESAHIGGLSMGGAVALNFGIRYPEMARSLIVAGAGTGSVDPDDFRRTANRLAEQMETRGMQAMSDYAKGPVRVQLMSKDPLGWERFASQFMSHSSVGSSRTFRGFQARRAPIFDLEPELRAPERTDPHSVR